MSAFGNLFQGQLNFAWTSPRHAVKWGAEARLNRDTTYFGTSPNGEYDFGGGTVYSPVFIPSASGQHDVQPGQPLPDTLSSLLLGYPYGYTIAVAPPYASNGAHIGPAAINRNDVNAYIEDTWKINPQWTLDYGLRYELYTPISERANRTSSFLNSFPPAGVGQEYLINPQPTYQTDRNGWGPRVQVDWNAPQAVHVHMGGAITVIPPNIWQDNLLTGSTPYVVYPRVNAAQNGEIAYGFQITPNELPPVYNTAGVNVLASGDPKKVPANTVMDVNRYQQDLAALSPSRSALAAESGRDRPALRQWLPANLDAGAGAGFRRPHGRCRVCRNIGVSTSQNVISKRVSRSGFGICAVYKLRRQRSGDGRFRIRVRDDSNVALVVQRLADLIVGKCWARRSVIAGRLHLGQITG